MKDARFTISGEERVLKDSDEIWAVGSIDEANAFVGLAKIFSKGEIRKILEYIQVKLFYVGSEFITGERYIKKSDISEIEKMIYRLESVVKKPKSFIILEQNEITAFLSVARAMIRRAERYAVRLNLKGKVENLTILWLDKLSHLFYLMILKELNGDYVTVKIEKNERELE